MNKVLRKVYTKTNSKSLIFNIPLEFAEVLNIKRGDYLAVNIKDTKIYIEQNPTRDSIIRRVYSKENSNSLIFNVPIAFANELKIKCGDYLMISLNGVKIVLERLDIEGGKENE